MIVNTFNIHLSNLLVTVSRRYDIQFESEQDFYSVIFSRVKNTDPDFFYDAVLSVLTDSGANPFDHCIRMLASDYTHVIESCLTKSECVKEKKHIRSNNFNALLLKLVSTIISGNDYYDDITIIIKKHHRSTGRTKKIYNEMKHIHNLCGEFRLCDLVKLFDGYIESSNPSIYIVGILSGMIDESSKKYLSDTF
jgi:hypothetical protein